MEAQVPLVFLRARYPLAMLPLLTKKIQANIVSSSTVNTIASITISSISMLTFVSSGDYGLLPWIKKLGIKS